MKQGELIAWFNVYHDDNPDQYEFFCKLASQMAEKRDHYGARSIIEVMRWYTSLDAGEPYKIANDVPAFYARKWTMANQQHKGFFRMKWTKHIDYMISRERFNDIYGQSSEAPKQV